MSFTDKLYIKTKDAHKVVDKHPFVSLIKENTVAGDMYVNFNKMCIYEIQNVLQLNDKILQNNLHRNIDAPNIYVSDTFYQLLQHCKKFPIESSYQFYLGLLFGGNMLKKMLPEHNDFLTYKNPTELIKQFKYYLCNNISESNQEQFINNVNISYNLIKNLFDEFYNTLTKLES